MRLAGVLLTGLCLTLLALNPTQAQVKIWEKTVTLPTYQTGAADINPRFYDGRVTQGAQGKVYPYPMRDVLADERIDEDYRMVYLENEYIKISILPKFGGRIFSAVDKTNDYDFFYRQTVIKPALIGTLGAWLSGGVEWNYPHHHRPTTLIPVDYRIQRHDDGSATLWTANTEQRHRTRLSMAITLRPGKSVVEVTVMPYNRSPLVHSFLYFANPAVHVDDSYQVIFPPNVEYVTQHAKREFSEWPISYSNYGGRQYEGVNISWWKNLPNPASFFAWNYETDYFAGYNHDKQAGVAYVANHHIAPGMKFFAWGRNDENLMWDKMLTDEDGSYLELMAGAYSDNQPDYSWLQPYESKRVTQYWFPIRELDGMKYVNLNGAINLELTDTGAEIRVNTTAEQRGVKVALEANGAVLYEETADISPEKPYRKDVRLSTGADRNVTLVVYGGDGEALMQYTPQEKDGDQRPASVTPPPRPADIKTVEELYLAGLRLNQFYNAVTDAEPYYTEALRRDPGNYRVNTQLGILRCKQLRWQEAEAYLRTAIKRITHHYTMPKDGEAFYYMGIALKAQGRLDEAYDWLYKATWSQAWHSNAYYALAEIDCRRGQYTDALAHLERSISTNTKNLKALDLRAVVTRKSGEQQAAEQMVRAVLDANPMDLHARNELSIMLTGKNARTEQDALRRIMQDNPDAYLELALDYGNVGFYDEAIDVLNRIAGSTNTPLVEYYLGWYSAQQGDRDAALQHYRRAAALSPDYCFPYRAETVDVLRHAMQLNPADSRAPYYLGNLLFDHQPEAALEVWESSRALDDNFSIVHRNLALAYQQVQHDIPAAISSLERAVQCNPNDPRLLYELDVLYEKGKTSLEQRRRMLETHQSTVDGRVDAMTRQVLVYLQAGQLDDALRKIETGHFYRWEGGDAIHGLFVDACLLRGRQRLQTGDAAGALRDFETAESYPANLERGRPGQNSRLAQVALYIGLAHKALGNVEKARDSFRQAVQEDASNTLYLYDQGRAWEQLGETGKAAIAFNAFWDYANGESQADFFAKFDNSAQLDLQNANNHYLMGLAFSGKRQGNKAREQFELAARKNPNHYWAKAYLQESSAR
jgi:tetratricopeptide (TPR) repeat protein